MIVWMPTRLCVSQWLLTNDSSAFLWNGQYVFLKYDGPGLSSACLKAEAPCVPDNLFGSLLMDNHCVTLAYLCRNPIRGVPTVDLNICIPMWRKGVFLALMETSAYPGYLVQERYPGVQPWRTFEHYNKQRNSAVHYSPENLAGACYIIRFNIRNILSFRNIQWVATICHALW